MMKPSQLLAPFLLLALAEGQYTVEATETGYGKDARTPVKAGDEQVNLRLEKQGGILVTVLAKIVIKQGCRVEGSVIRSGTPVANVQVSLTLQTDEGETPQHYVFDTVYTDAKGKFKSSRPLPADRYEIQAIQFHGLTGIFPAQRSIQTITLHPGPKPRIVHLRLPVD